MNDDADLDAGADRVERSEANDPRRQKRLEEKRNVTSRVSETCRFIGFGLIVAYYTAALDAEAGVPLVYAGPLYVVGIAGVLTVLFDYLQYVCGVEAVKSALKRADYTYDDEALSYRARQWFYDLKQATALVGGVVLIYAVVSGNF